LTRGADTTAPRIAAVSPAPGSFLVDNVGVRRINVTFDEPVVVPAGAVRLRTLGSGPINGFSTSLDALAQTLTISLSAPILSDVVTVVLDYAITDQAGNALDGEATDPEIGFVLTGDGAAGGQAVFRFRALQGDANRDTVVDDLDRQILLGSLGALDGDANFNPAADLNSDGAVNVLDVAILLQGMGTSLSVTDSVGPAVVSIVPDPNADLSADISQATVAFTEALDAAKLDPRAFFLKEIGGPAHGECAAP